MNVLKAFRVMLSSCQPMVLLCLFKKKQKTKNTHSDFHLLDVDNPSSFKTAFVYLR